MPAGCVVNGDGVLLLMARDMKTHVRLHNDTVVATTMSNMGLEAALKRSGIRMLRAPVGDKYVLEEMLKTGATLGGEQSGHILFRDMDTTTGDGILTALRVLEVMARTGKPLAELVADMKVFPQEIKNVQVREKRPFEQLPAVMEAIRAAERELEGNGRVVVRYSGTEKLARVMIEAESEQNDAPSHRCHRECDTADDWNLKHHRDTETQRNAEIAVGFRKSSPVLARSEERLLQIPPILPHSHFHLQRHFERMHVLHSLSDQRLHGVHFVLGRFEDEFVVHLQQHPRA